MEVNNHLVDPKFVEVEGKPGVFPRGKYKLVIIYVRLLLSQVQIFPEMIEEIVILANTAKIATTEPMQMDSYRFRVEADCYNISDRTNGFQQENILKFMYIELFLTKHM